MRGRHTCEIPLPDESPQSFLHDQAMARVSNRLLDRMLTSAPLEDSRETHTDIVDCILSIQATFADFCQQSHQRMILDVSPELPAQIDLHRWPVQQILASLVGWGVMVRTRLLALQVLVEAAAGGPQLAFSLRDTGTGDIALFRQGIAEALENRQDPAGVDNSFVAQMRLARYLVEQIGGTVKIDIQPTLGTCTRWTLPFSGRCLYHQKPLPECLCGDAMEMACDYAQMMDMLQDDHDLYQEIVGLFHQELPALHRIVERSVIAHDGPRLHRSALHLQSMLANFHTPQAVKAAAWLGSIGTHGHWQDGPEAMLLLNLHLDRLESILAH